MVTIKPRLRELLNERGLTQGQLSEMTDIPHSIKLGGHFYIKKPRFLMNTLCIPINNYINAHKFLN